MKKLKLNKQTISLLNNNDLGLINGGKTLPSLGQLECFSEKIICPQPIQSQVAGCGNFTRLDTCG